MLRYFRINDPYRLLGLLIFLLIIYLPLFIDPAGLTYPELKSVLVGEKINEGSKMYTEVIDNSAPLAAWFNGLMDMVFGRSMLARHILAFVIIFLQSAFLGIMFIGRKVFSENTYISSLVFSMLFLFSFDTLSLSDELLGSGFLLLALNSLFAELEFRLQRDETPFNMGLFISLATLFYFPFVVFLFAILITLFFFARTSARKILLLVFGFLLPHFLVMSIAFLRGTAPATWKYFYLSNLTIEKSNYMSTTSLLVLGAIPLFYLVVSIIMLNRQARFSKYQSQILQSMFLWIGFSFIFIIFCRDLRPQTLIVLFPGFSFLITYFLLLIRRKKFAEMNIWILVAGIITVSYLSRYGKIKSVDYSRMLVPPALASQDPDNKKVLVLGNDIGIYTKHRVATPYLNWQLSERIFRAPEYYENITGVYHAFKNDPPALIVDQENLLKPFLERMPEFKKQYVKQGEGYVRVSN